MPGELAPESGDEPSRSLEIAIESAEELTARVAALEDQLAHLEPAVRGSRVARMWFVLRDLLNYTANAHDGWRRLLGALTLAGLAYGAWRVFDWIQGLEAQHLTWPRAVFGASIAAFFVGGLRFVDRMTMRETLLMKIHDPKFRPLIQVGKKE